MADWFYSRNIFNRLDYEARNRKKEEKEQKIIEQLQKEKH